jgi:hypothetical protein
LIFVKNIIPWRKLWVRFPFHFIIHLPHCKLSYFLSLNNSTNFLKSKTFNYTITFLERTYNSAWPKWIQRTRQKVFMLGFEVPVMGFSGLPLGSPKTKCHLDVAPVERRKKYYKGEAGGSNVLFGLCKSEWMNKLLVFLPSPIPELQHALLPSKCCKPRSVPRFFTLPMFSFQTHIWVY